MIYVQCIVAYVSKSLAQQSLFKHTYRQSMDITERILFLKLSLLSALKYALNTYNLKKNKRGILISWRNSAFKTNAVCLNQISSQKSCIDWLMI